MFLAYTVYAFIFLLAENSDVDESRRLVPINVRLVICGRKDLSLKPHHNLHLWTSVAAILTDRFI
jgi:hypothetical protein